MRSFDFTPLYRTAIGFDRMVELLQQSLQFEPNDGYPPYDIEKTGEDSYRITMAVAGLTPDEISIIVERNVLTVAGEKGGNGSGQYLHHGIATRAFKRRFELADFVRVTGAKLDSGLLSVDLVRELPEEMKPRRIPVTTGAAEPKAIDKKAA
jgi:molecular chaperone IbpA